MGLFTQTLKSLIAGVSQQAEVVKYPEQLKEQVNGFSSEARGLKRRPPTVLLKNIGKILKDSLTSLVHMVDRDNHENYFVIVTPEGIQVTDLAGNIHPVRLEDGTEEYLKTTNPRQSLSLKTIGDYTFVVNKEVEVKMADIVPDNVWDNQGLLVHVKQGQYGRTYQLIVNGKSYASHTTPDGSNGSHSVLIDTNYIVTQLMNQVHTTGGYVMSSGNSWFEFLPTQADPQVFTYNATGTYTYTVPENVTEIVISGQATSNVSTGGKEAIRWDGMLGSPVHASTDSTISGLSEPFLLKAGTAEVASPRRYKVEPLSTLQVTVGHPMVLGSQRGNTGYIRILTTAAASMVESFESKDGFNNQSMKMFRTNAQQFTDLPSTAPADYTLEIIGTVESSSDDYYVTYDKEREGWVETVRPGLVNDFNLTTMPHGLVREATGEFVFKTLEWEPRMTGDDDSNPLPSFVGQTLSSLFFFRNRIGLLSGESMVTTRSSYLFDFWVSSASSLTDTDPIDISANHPSRVVTLTHAVPMEGALLLFADRAQFALNVEGTLSPATAHIVLLTDFAFSPYANPTGAGRNVYFAYERYNYASIKEFYTMQNVTESKNANDISSHISEYIPEGVHKLIAGVSENILLTLTEGAENQIYVYKYLFLDEQRVQSAWSHWDFGKDAKIIGGGFIGSTLYLLILRPEGVCIEKMIFTADTTDFEEEPYRIHLDRKVHIKALPETAYDEMRDLTTLNLHDYYEDWESSDQVALVSSDGKYIAIQAHEVSSGLMELQGDLTGQSLFLGYICPFRIVLSTFMIKTVDETGVRAETEGRLQLRKGWLSFNDTGYLRVTVKYRGKPDGVYVMTGKHLGVDAKFNELSASEGIWTFPIQTQNTQCEIIVENDTPLPLALLGAGWEGSYTSRSRST